MSSPSLPRIAAGASPARRRRILAAAMRLFADLPYVDVHMDAIAAAANVAKPTLYRYVPTKEALFIEGLDWTLAEMRHALAAVRAAGSDHAARLGSAVEIVLDGIRPLSPALRAVEGASSELGERSRRILRAGFAALREELGHVLEDGIAAGAFAPRDVDLAVLMILGTVRMTAASPERRAHGAAALTALFLDGLRPAASAVPLRGMTAALGEAA